MTSASPRLLRILRCSLAGCWIGHGAFGLIGKSAWLPYFAVCGIRPELAWKLMPLVGAMDVSLGLATLLLPWRSIWAWAAVWTTFTALLRPLAHQGWPEFFERAGNYGPPVILLLLIAGARTRWLDRTFRIAIASLLAGHAGCGLLLHSGSQQHNLAAFDAGHVTQWLGLSCGIDLALAGAVLLAPSLPLLLAIALWKMGTEALFPLAGAPFWEFVERSGSYGLPLAYAFYLHEASPPPVPARDFRGDVRPL